MRILACLLAAIVTAAGPVSADDAAGPDGESIYKRSCAHCHDRTLPRMPSIADLKKKDPRDIFSTISAGLMAPYTRDLTHAERRAVTEYASGQPLGDFASGAAAIPKSAFCANDPDNPIQDIDSGWNGWGNDLENTRFQSAERAGLTAADVPRLKMKWAFGVPAVSTMSGHPIVVDGRLFFGTFSGLVIALNADTGCALWVFEALAGVRTALTLGKLADGTVSLFFGDLSGKVYAIDPETGQERWNIIADDHPHVRITGSPVYYGNRLYVPISSLEEIAGAMPDYECCTFRGGVMAVDAATGESIWKRHTIAEAPSKRGKNAIGAQLWAPSGAAVWTAPTLDPDNNTIYIVTGDSYSDPAAPESDAVMALEMDTGKIKWIQQTLAGDAFTIACTDPSPESQVACPASNGPDLDFGSSAALVTLAGGRRILLAGQKSGKLYALDPATGEILWETEVGDGGIVGGIEWGFAVDGEKAYVAIAEAWEQEAGEAGGITAGNIADGSIAWEVGPPQDTCDGRERCNTGQLAAVTGMPGVVFSGSLDGHLRAYSVEDGRVVWDYDTVNGTLGRGGSLNDPGPAVANGHVYVTVNGTPGRGGSLNGPGPAVANGHVYVVSGYAMWNLWMPGNVLLAFSVDGK